MGLNVSLCTEQRNLLYTTHPNLRHKHMIQTWTALKTSTQTNKQSTSYSLMNKELKSSAI